MKRLGALVKPPPVWVNPQHLVEVATVLMRGMHLHALPVVEVGEVVGLITALHLLNAPAQAPVSDFMSTEVLVLNPEMTAREGAALMAQKGVDVAVIANDKLLGTIRAIDLIPEVSRSYDPMTKLPWQDALREWSIEKLRSGQEISILFFDIDQFGQFNKQYDHVTGDRVLRMVAETIERELDEDLTVLCRYGGDEFAVATLCMQEEAQQLAARIARRVEDIQIPGVRETIMISYGVFGGRRTRERDQTHYAATVDDLITRASRQCMQMKQRRSAIAMLQLPLPGVELEEQSEPRVQVTALSYIIQAKEAEATVELSASGVRALRQVRGDAKQPPEELMVQAARDALIALVPSLASLQVHHVSRVTLNLPERSDAMNGVMVVVEAPTNSGNQIFSGFALVRDNVHRAAVNALLNALNRQLSRWLAQSRIGSAK